ncbi:phosphatidylinositol-binding protein scs2 [Exophiala xenobiotica]|nr:phosphatidylinositol-binding protein scs2 [Exophiala xenobiotica]
MSVELHPAELGFRRPFTREVTETLKLANGNDAPLAFKVKTTAPKQYCVRPNSGMIPPNSEVEVQVLLQAMKEEPPLDAKCRDKFLVQTVLTSADQDPNVTTLWQTVEKTAKHTIQEKKIRVNFLPAGASTPNGTSSHEEQPPAYSSPSPQFDSPAPRSSIGGVSTAESARTSMANAAEAIGLTSAATTIANAVPTSNQELQDQLATARAQIKKLSEQVQDPQFRQRKVQEASEKVQTVVQQSNESGVPLQIVAGLCLLSFLIAYLFF